MVLVLISFGFKKLSVLAVVGAGYFSYFLDCKFNDLLVEGKGDGTFSSN